MNTYYVGNIPVTDELYHHGILGQKWGIRRFQNPDGTLTPAGKKRYGYGISESTDTGGSGGTSRAHYKFGGKSEKQGIRRYQNRNGSLTAEGEKRYGSNVSNDEAFKNFLSEDKKTQYKIAKRYTTVSPKTLKKDIKRGNKDALRDDFHEVQEGLNNKAAYKGKIQNTSSQSARRQLTRSNLFGKASNMRAFIKEYDPAARKMRKEIRKFKDPEDAKEAAKKFQRSFEDKFASALLKDAKFEDTKYARDWLTSQPWYWRDFGGQLSWRELFDDY